MVVSGGGGGRWWLLAAVEAGGGRWLWVGEAAVPGDTAMRLLGVLLRTALGVAKVRGAGLCMAGAVGCCCCG